MTHPFLQIFILTCFIILVIILFFEQKDFILYSIFLIFLGSFVTSLFIPEASEIDFYIVNIEWELIVFLLAMFTIVEVLREKLVFREIAIKIVNKYKDAPRKMFYIICITSTFLAAIVEDLSVALIFGPIIIIVCRNLNLKAAPYLLGMTISINLAATLTPFGSAQNILIASEFNLDVFWFITRLGVYFAISIFVTLFFLDKLVLKKSLIPKPKILEKTNLEAILLKNVEGSSIHKGDFKKNIINLGIFIALLVLIPELYIAGLLGMFLFVITNPFKKDERKSKNTSLMHYLQKIDYKLIYFFISLFVFVSLMEVNGTLLLIEGLIENLSSQNTFLVSLIILIVTSLLSGFLDNTPVVVIFIPIIRILFNVPGFPATPLLVAFIIGINVGGNFLPQGSACDMATLEIAKNNNVSDLNFRRLVKIGGIFALIHVLIAIGYLALITFVFPF